MHHCATGERTARCHISALIFGHI